MSATPPFEQPATPPSAPARPTAGALLVATAPAGPSGRSERSDRAAETMLWQRLRGRPLVGWALDALLAVPAVAVAAVITRPERAEEARALATAQPASQAGQAIHAAQAGPGWRAALAAGLAALDPALEWVIAHDAARPLITPEGIAAGLAAARAGAGVALAGEPGADTLKRVAGGRVVETLDRARLWRLQPPLAIRRALLDRALASPDIIVTSGLAEIARASGARVAIYPPGAPNPAITTPADWPVAISLLAHREAR